MKVLVTGGAGYIGSVLTPMLLAKGHHVTVIDSFIDNQVSLLDCCYRKNLKIIRADLGTFQMRLAQEHDAIIHLASIVGAKKCDENKEEAKRTNLDLTIGLLSNLKKGCPFIFTNTNSGYQPHPGHLVCDETSPITPNSLYGKSKIEAESHVLKAGGISLRLASVFGISPKYRNDLLVNNFVYRALKDKKIELFESHYKRNFLHIRDACSAIIHSVDKFDAMKGEVYNVGIEDANITKMELAERVKKFLPETLLLKSKSSETDPDQRNYLISNTKLIKTGYTTFFTLDDGINELIKGYIALGIIKD